MGEEEAPKIELSEVALQVQTSKTVSANSFSPKDQTILIVDDNEDFRSYLVENLRNDYNILEAEMVRQLLKRLVYTYLTSFCRMS